MNCTRAKLGYACPLFLVAMLLDSTTVQAQTLLRYKFKEGEKLNYVMEQKMKMQMKIGDNNVDMQMNQTMDLGWKVNSVDKDGNAAITQKIERIRMRMEGPFGKVEFDSKEGKEMEGPLGQMVGPMLKALASAEFTVTMDPLGKINNFKVPQKVSEAFKNLPQGMGAGGMFSEEGMKQMSGQASVLLPSEPVRMGKTWNQKVDMPMPMGGGKMKMDNQYTYEGEAALGDKKLEKIAVKPQMAFEAGDKAPFKMKMKSQEGKGQAYFDNQAGHLDAFNLQQNMEMEVNAGGQDINQKVDQTVTMKLGK